MKDLSFKKFLLEAFETEYGDERVDEPYDQRQDKSDYIKRLTKSRTTGDAGAYGFIKRDKDNPFTVEKQPHMADANIDKDAYYRYINYVTKNKLAQDNPFLPRVYSVKDVADPSNNKKYKIDIESLTPLTGLSTAQLQQMGENLFTNFNEIRKSISGNLNGHQKGTIRKALADGIAECLERNYQAKDNTIENQLLRQALTVVRKVKMSGRFAYDLSANNLMARMTPHGPQLVIVDPLA